MSCDMRNCYPYYTAEYKQTDMYCVHLADACEEATKQWMFDPHGKFSIMEDSDGDSPTVSLLRPVRPMGYYPDTN